MSPHRGQRTCKLLAIGCRLLQFQMDALSLYQNQMNRCTRTQAKSLRSLKLLCNTPTNFSSIENLGTLLRTADTVFSACLIIMPFLLSKKNVKAGVNIRDNLNLQPVRVLRHSRLRAGCKLQVHRFVSCRHFCRKLSSLALVFFLPTPLLYLA